MKLTYKRGDSIFPDATRTTTLNTTRAATVSEELSCFFGESDVVWEELEAMTRRTHSPAELVAMDDRVIAHVDRTIADFRRLRTVVDRVLETTQRYIPPAEYTLWIREDPKTWADLYGIQLPPGTASETIIASILQEQRSRREASMSIDGTSVSTAQGAVADVSLGETLDAFNTNI